MTPYRLVFGGLCFLTFCGRLTGSVLICCSILVSFCLLEICLFWCFLVFWKWISCDVNLPQIKIVATCISDYRRGLDWWMDLLTTHTSNYSSIASSTLYKSPQHTLSFPSCCVVFISRSQVTASDSGGSSASAMKSALNAHFLHRLPYRPDSVSLVVFFITPLNGPNRKHHF
jgi:hypothetical protein